MNWSWLLGTRIPPCDEAEANLRQALPADGSQVEFTPWLARNLAVLHANGLWHEQDAPSRDTPRRIRRAYLYAHKHATWYAEEMRRSEAARWES